MFDIGWSELVVIGIVALIAIGPKELPGVLRAVGQWVGKIRRMASDFQGQFQEAMREAEVADLKKQFDEASNAASNITSGFDDPLAKVNKELESAFDDPGAVNPPGTSAPQAAAPREPDLPQVTGNDSPVAPAQTEEKRGGSA